jgi:hypothetical protein
MAFLDRYLVFAACLSIAPIRGEVVTGAPHTLVPCGRLLTRPCIANNGSGLTERVPRLFGRTPARGAPPQWMGSPRERYKGEDQSSTLRVLWNTRIRPEAFMLSFPVSSVSICPRWLTDRDLSMPLRFRASSLIRWSRPRCTRPPTHDCPGTHANGKRIAIRNWISLLFRGSSARGRSSVGDRKRVSWITEFKGRAIATIGV